MTRTGGNRFIGPVELQFLEQEEKRGCARSFQESTLSLG